MNCNICKSNISKNLELREMMYGTKEIFLYKQCEKCGHIQIDNIPSNLSKYYDEGYYSKKEDTSLWYSNLIIKNLKKIKENSKLYLNVNYDGYIGNTRYPIIKMFKNKWINKNTEILDVGCGAGELLFYLNNVGFRNLEGADPFIENNIKYENLLIKKSKIEDLTNKYDLIISSHQLEHVIDPVSEIKSFINRLNENGLILIRTPVSDNKVYDKYKENWFQLDAPRHLNIFSRSSLIYLIESSNLEIIDIINDSNFDCNYLSDLYSKGISLHTAMNDEHLKPTKKLNNYRELKKEVDEMNHANEADQVSIIVRVKK
jgi:2-polyprenyl-3-methyl-5-hydroxy-6-metoxy-1,4-benzoquinol methylase